MVWELHRAIGIWTVAFLAMSAITGLSFVFPSQFRAAVHAISPITVLGPPPRSKRQRQSHRQPGRM